MSKLNDFNSDVLVFNQDGLIPVVVQDTYSKTVLMLAYMNKEALEQTIKSKEGTYYSRKRQALWKKGETSGNTQSVVGLTYDCDADTLLMEVKQTGVACHKNKVSCFHNPIIENDSGFEDKILFELYDLVKERFASPKEGAYTSYLFEKGIDKILKKVGEESSEVIIAAKNHDVNEMVYEISDLMYHLIVLMVNENVPMAGIFLELAKRRR